MAKVKLNHIVDELHGQVGDLVFREAYGQTIVGRKPGTNGDEPTPEQVETRERFKQAVAYSRMVNADEQARALYESAAEQKRKPLFSVIMADFLNPPTIQDVDSESYNGAIGEPIYIRAYDDFGVQRVHVAIENSAGGAALESGDAQIEAGGTGRWVYTSQMNVPAGTRVKIIVSVSDRPGGLKTFEFEQTC